MFQFPGGLPPGMQGMPGLGLPSAGPPRLDLPASLGGGPPGPPRGSDPLMSLGGPSGAPPSAAPSNSGPGSLRAPSTNDKVISFARLIESLLFRTSSLGVNLRLITVPLFFRPPPEDQ